MASHEVPVSNGRDFARILPHMNTDRASRTALVWSSAYTRHDTGAHPESPERVRALERALRAAGMFDDRLVLDPVPAALESVLAVHTPSVVDLIQRAAHQGGAWLDPDTFVSADSYEVALLAAGGACRAVDAVLNAEASRAFALVRPPGHHAEPDAPMGFCLFNNAAVAAEHALGTHGLERVAIVDWDVHHGNGTQAAFWSDPRVLFISLHQYPFYPGTGSGAERGAGAGEGYTLNLPLVAGGGDEVYTTAFKDAVLPALRAFAPELLLVSAGFDAHASDPLAMMRMSTEGYAQLASMLHGVAQETCAGRLVLVLEGGYNLRALGDSVVATLHALDAS
jgi:acetoin utilization deacetylase AcuC-like enzyme